MKQMQVEIALGPLRRFVNFVGASVPGFEDPPRTSDAGRDLPVDTVLRVRWEKLTFDGHDAIFGPIKINMVTQSSTGRVYSLANPERRGFGDWLVDGETSSGGFFPAVNENRLYFNVEIPRFALRLVNSDPVENGALIGAIPPKGIEYRLKDPVDFHGPRYLPLKVRLGNCRMAMTVLNDVRLEVTDFRRSVELQSRLNVRVTNESSAETVRLAVTYHSWAGIVVQPAPHFVHAAREPIDLVLDLDARKANPPGFVTIGVVLIEPYESPGASQMNVDYDEVRLGRRDDRAPDFSAGAYVRSSLRNE